MTTDDARASVRGEPGTHPCPGCGGPTDPSPTCHTWPQTFDGKTTWMACMPCDSATEWTCWPEDLDDDGCGWRWTEGLNPDNPRAAENEANRPPWALAGASEAPK